ncbi:MAG: sulfatase-like hydrolase/transferase [Opitutaceae bacterium]|nr:sulfatase-like hydrolase/transferase [Opitutaceae bacterium]
MARGFHTKRRLAHAKKTRGSAPTPFTWVTLGWFLSPVHRPHRMQLPPFLQRRVASRHGGTVLFYLLFLAIALLTRVALLVKSAGVVSWNLSLLGAFGCGLVYDMAAAGLWALPITLLLTLLPAGFFAKRWARALAHVAAVMITAGLLFTAVSEWTFWDEFGVRFNFIAVDYLVYTTEVIGNIRESYNMPLILGGIAAGSLVIYGLAVRTGWIALWLNAARTPLKPRLVAGLGWFMVPLAFGLVLDSNYLPAFRNDYNRELAKNGPWSFIAAFRNNELDYDKFYPTLDLDEAFRRLHAEQAPDGAQRLGSEARDTLRYVRNEGPELRPNIIQITVESLSADFLSIFNHASRLTPNLEEIAKKSLVFDQFYATGTRTDRGMEALTLALPPTPGRSIVKRPRNANLFTLGSVLTSRGYDTAFIYGGYGYFDNMNTYFGNNGYRVIDRAAVDKADITFANAWGACDEDLFRWTVREADKSAATGRPFHYFVMTTSNHRPFTYPDGRIDLPSKIAGRAGAVKYTDFAIGQLIKEAATKPWFKNTIFVIVADHCASSAGKSELPVQNYHIPLIIYAPGGQIAPGHVSAVMSQVDFAPTLLGLLNWSYASRFYGWDVRKATGPGRALVGNYQRLGLFRDNRLTVLEPVRRSAQYVFDPRSFALTPQPADENFRGDAIAYYQTASYLYKNSGYGALTAAEQAAWAAKAGEGKPPQP